MKLKKPYSENGKAWKIKKDPKSKQELEYVEKELTDKYANAKEYFDKIKERTGNTNEDENVNIASLWNLKKELFPQSRNPPTAMKDPKKWRPTYQWG